MKCVLCFLSLLLLSMSIAQAQEPLYRLSFNNTLANAVEGYQDPVASGDPVFTVSQWGGPNEAISFDGQDDYLTMGTAVPGLSGESLKSGTISFWLKHNSAVTSLGIIGTYNDGITEAFDIRYNNSNTLGLYLRARNSNVSRDTISASAEFPPTVDGEWRHVTISWDMMKTENPAQIYLDGVAVGSSLREGSGDTSGVFEPFTYPFVLGAWNVRGALSRFAKVEIDDLRVYEDVLTPAQVLDLVPVELSLFELE